ncbi:enoyl-[acyl-carrier protein] reductase I [Prauserella sediminis]|uniref:Enoyl-[acyl-carrier-protein] reductase [NADH] n=1 Tax=Prauserella sediminis TaxID=577680 RepID=A0A839XC99_9PSEU|nr:enoyl-ACP reductase FabI [Prauserella sediminis]MBB3661592.1 enoyl-[acyl-carrier protein] reductase I [Prauserella sediminis]
MNADTGLLAGKRILITGVITETSIAYQVARVAQEQGAQVVLTGYGRVSLVERIATRLPQPAPVVELDVTDPADLAALPGRVREHVDGLDGVVHSVAFAPEACFGDFLAAEWSDVAPSLHVSAYSMKALAVAVLPLLSRGSSVVGMDFDARVAWPDYDWMGVAKAALESVTRYLARELGPSGVRVNLVASGPLRTMAAKSIPGFAELDTDWDRKAPLGWDAVDGTGVAKSVCAVLSDWLPTTTGSMVWADGGVHAVGS